MILELVKSCFSEGMSFRQWLLWRREENDSDKDSEGKSEESKILKRFSEFGILYLFRSIQWFLFFPQLLLGQTEKGIISLFLYIITPNNHGLFKNHASF